MSYVHFPLQADKHRKFGFIRSFFTDIQAGGYSKDIPMKSWLSRSQSFDQSPDEYVYHGNNVHPIIIVFNVLRTLNFGNGALEDLSPTDTMATILSKHILCQAYQIILLYYGCDELVLFSAGRHFFYYFYHFIFNIH